ncbi:rhomboid family intramembrane serine protease [Pseudolysinimonas sp.]|uniref:rhomboid family intramembrane serine protease n=1 Tax=Pseudolysinimonas sp. TaxID=2680009 RepID=UPI003F811AC8
MTDHAADPAPDYCYRHPDRPTYIHCQRCDRPICTECQTPAPVGVLCPEEMRDARASIAASRGGATGTLRRLLPQGVPVVTYVIMGLCILVYLAQVLIGSVVTGAGALDPSRIASEPWRMLTSAFLHSPGSVLHILFNLYALFIFGPMLERFLGRLRFLALYLVTALGGSLGVVLVYQLWVVTDRASATWIGTLLAPSAALGASGAIFGLLGATIAMRKALGVQPVQLIIVVIANLAFSFFVPGIAWEAHVGGLLTGLAVGAVLMRSRRTDQRTTQILGIAGVAAALVIITVLCVVTHPEAYA